MARLDRRTFLSTAALGLAAAASGGEVGSAPLPRRKLGKTGARLSIIGLGGIVVPFAGIKLIDMGLTAVGLA